MWTLLRDLPLDLRYVNYPLTRPAAASSRSSTMQVYHRCNVSARRFDAPPRQRPSVAAAAAGHAQRLGGRTVACRTATFEHLLTAEGGGTKRSGSPVPCPILDQAPPVHEDMLTVSDGTMHRRACSTANTFQCSLCWRLHCCIALDANSPCSAWRSAIHGGSSSSGGSCSCSARSHIAKQRAVKHHTSSIRSCVQAG